MTHLVWEKGCRVCEEIFNRDERKSHVELKQVQKLMGSINDVAQMCPLMRAHKWSGNHFLKKFEGNENISLMVPDLLKQDLVVIMKMVDSSRTGLPIATEPAKPTLSAVEFYTDAAGVSFSRQNGRMICHDNKGRGVACVGGENEKSVWGWTKLLWPVELLTTLRDECGVLYGHKSTTLESVGLLLPLLTFPDRVCGRNVVIYVDNIAVVYGWAKGLVKKDRTASEILKAVQYLSRFLGVTLHVEHVPRMSNPLAAVADELSRKEYSFNGRTNRILEDSECRQTASWLSVWLRNPGGGSLSMGLLREVGEKHPTFCFAE